MPMRQFRKAGPSYRSGTIPRITPKQHGMGTATRSYAHVTLPERTAVRLDLPQGLVVALAARRPAQAQPARPMDPVGLGTGEVIRLHPAVSRGIGRPPDR